MHYKASLISAMLISIHYSNMSIMVTQITDNSIVCSTTCTNSLLDSLQKGPIMWKAFPCMESSCHDRWVKFEFTMYLSDIFDWILFFLFSARRKYQARIWQCSQVVPATLYVGTRRVSYVQRVMNFWWIWSTSSRITKSTVEDIMLRHWSQDVLLVMR